MPKLPFHTRRGFIATAAAAPAVLRAQGAPDRMKVAFIGVGNRGGFLLRQMLGVEGVDIIAICDIVPETLAKAIEAATAAGHKPVGYADYRKMIDDRKDIEAIVIATPVDTHIAPTLAALEAGKHVYCEKPMALTPAECVTIHKATLNAKGIYQAGFQLRHDPARSTAMKHIKAGGIGKLLYAQGYRHTGDLPRNEPWLFDRVRSGDNIVEQACHIIDLFVWAIDKTPLRAMGSGGINLYKDIPPGRTTTDNYSVIYEFPEDIRVNFSHIYFDPPGFSGIKERLFGSLGAVDLPTGKWNKIDQKGEIALEVPDAGGKRSDFLSVQAFIQNAREKKTPLNNADSALRSTLVAMMGRKAIHEKRIVTWEEMLKA
jgi:predicted dehydrogenase